MLRGDRPREALVGADAVLERTEDAADMAALHAAALRIRAAARLQLGDAEPARRISRERRCGSKRRSGPEAALALDLLAVAEADEAARRESAELLERLGVERLALAASAAGRRLRSGGVARRARRATPRTCSPCVPPIGSVLSIRKTITPSPPAVPLRLTMHLICPLRLQSDSGSDVTPPSLLKQVVVCDSATESTSFA